MWARVQLSRLRECSFLASSFTAAFTGREEMNPFLVPLFDSVSLNLTPGTSGNWRATTGLLTQMPGPGKWQRKFRSPEFPIFRGSFSSVSTLLIARVGAFFSIHFYEIYTNVTPLHRSSAIFCVIFQVFFEMSGFLQNLRIFQTIKHFSLENFTEFCRNYRKW